MSDKLSASVYCKRCGIERQFFGNPNPEWYCEFCRQLEAAELRVRLAETERDEYRDSRDIVVQDANRLSAQLDALEALYRKARSRYASHVAMDMEPRESWLEKFNEATEAAIKAALAAGGQ